ncbi:integral membrane protein [Colletotrichum plurivorum]|uniref:Integral membrane protein n=1 Tax=Colletotrichum plurivorum TaxID=2175906 RepID=A0A8H6N3T0_9PEZI|nr:integral membrane protein [Colletotrichum plurivorum]
MAETIKGALDLSREESMAITALATAGIYNALEIYVLIFSTFRQRRGRYFWSMMVANTGIFVHAIVSLVRYLRRGNNVVPGAFAIAAWCAMVTGQSVVLWSRLHLVVYSRTWTRLVLALIVTDACAIHVPMIVLWVLCWATPASAQPAWLARYGVYEKVSIIIFTLQETLLTGIFARQGFFNLRPLFAFKTRSARLISWYLLSLFVLVFLLDVALVALEYTDNFVFQTTSKPLVYSVKLKVEFTVLNKLLAFTKMNSCDCHHLSDTLGGGGYTKGLVTSDTNTTTKAAMAAGQREGPFNGPASLPDLERPDHIFDG